MMPLSDFAARQMFSFAERRQLSRPAIAIFAPIMPPYADAFAAAGAAFTATPCHFIFAAARHYASHAIFAFARYFIDADVTRRYARCLLICRLMLRCAAP